MLGVWVSQAKKSVIRNGVLVVVFLQGLIDKGCVYSCVFPPKTLHFSTIDFSGGVQVVLKKKERKKERKKTPCGWIFSKTHSILTYVLELDLMDIL